jgi:hypothetical protein
VPLSYQTEVHSTQREVTLLTYHLFSNELDRFIPDLDPEVIAVANKRLVTEPRQPFRDVPNCEKSSESNMPIRVERTKWEIIDE